MPYSDKKKQKEYFKKYKQDHKEKLKEYYSDYRKKPEVREKRRLAQRKRQQILKRKVVEHYSNGKSMCECCKELDIRFLTVDHINGGGNKHRQEIFKEKLGKGNLYLWLVRNKLPSGFRILCWNCNVGREKNGGICPHKDIKIN